MPNTQRRRRHSKAFGGERKYAETLDVILESVGSYQPTTDELVWWHRGTFERVSSRESILRRVKYLQRVGFIQQNGNQWVLDEAGKEPARDQDVETLLMIMCNRNVGLRSLLYALAAGPMTIEEVSNQQLDKHPELGWSRGETDMTLQQVNWLRSMGLVEKQPDRYVLTDAGHQLVVNWNH